MEYPNIILLNGACSSGKTTLSNALRKIARQGSTYRSFMNKDV